MKNLFLLAFLCFLLVSCKKESTKEITDKYQEVHDLKLTITNVPEYTSYLINVQNYTQKKTVYPTINSTENTSYWFAVNPGDQLTAFYNFTEHKPNTNGNSGKGTATFSFNGQKLAIGSDGTKNMPISIPQ